MFQAGMKRLDGRQEEKWRRRRRRRRRRKQKKKICHRVRVWEEDSQINYCKHSCVFSFNCSFILYNDWMWWDVMRMRKHHNLFETLAIRFIYTYINIYIYRFVGWVSAGSRIPASNPFFCSETVSEYGMDLRQPRRMAFSTERENWSMLETNVMMASREPRILNCSGSGCIRLLLSRLGLLNA